MINEKVENTISDKNIENSKRKVKIAKIARWTTVIVVLAFSYIPFWIMLIGSLKSIEQFYYDPIFLPSSPLRFVNYVDAFKVVLRGFINSVLISGSILFGTLLVSSLSAYAFARFNFYGKKLLYSMIIVNMTIPGLLSMVPQYLVTVNVLNLANTYLGVILPGIAGGQIQGIFLTRTFIETLPKELFEAAKIDGASEFKVFFFITIPLIVPILITIGLMNVLGSWNDIVWPNLILEDVEKQTISIRMLSFNTIYGSDMGKMFAAYTLASIPLLAIFLPNMKAFMNSIAVGSVKG